MPISHQIWVWEPKGQRISFVANYKCLQEAVSYILRKGNDRTTIYLVIYGIAPDKNFPFKVKFLDAFVTVPILTLSFYVACSPRNSYYYLFYVIASQNKNNFLG